MSHVVKIHDTQTKILRELLFRPLASYSEIRALSGVNSDYFKFHLAKLVELGYVSKTSYGKYQLSTKGKEHANTLDTDTNTVERQPKLSVILVLKRKNNKGEIEYLYQQRLKNPYYGYWGRLGGKIRWGESFEEAARRELKEETGLDGTFKFKMVYRKIDFNSKTNDLLEDKLFIVMETTKFKGKLIDKFEGGFNKWMTPKDFKSVDKTFETSNDFMKIFNKHVPYISKNYFYDDTDY